MGAKRGGSQGTEACGHSLSPLSFCFAPAYQYIPERPLYLVSDYLITSNSLTEGPFKMKTLIWLPIIHGVFSPSFVTWHQSFERIWLSACLCNTTHRWLPPNISAPSPHTLTCKPLTCSILKSQPPLSGMLFFLFRTPSYTACQISTHLISLSTIILSWLKTKLSRIDSNYFYPRNTSFQHYVYTSSRHSFVLLMGT